MSLNLRCPACGHRQRASEAVLGKTIICPSCGGSFPVSGPVAKPGVAVPPAAPIPPASAAPRARPPAPPAESYRPQRPPEHRPQADPRPARADASVPPMARPGPDRPTGPRPGAEHPPHQGLPTWAYAILGCAGTMTLVSFIVLIRSLAGSSAARPPRPAVADRTATASAEPPPLPDIAPAPASAPGGGGAPLSTAQIVARCEPSVALVKGKASSGTGFLVRRDLIATNAHVIDDEFLSDLEIRFPSAPAADQGPIRAELLYEDPKRDLAFLAVRSGLPALDVARSYRFLKGEDITVIGNPGLGGEVVMENAINRGVMSSKTVIDGHDFLQMGIAINPGNSGGPVFDSSGRVIGVATLKASRAESMGFCIPVEDLNAALDRLDALPRAARAAIASRHRAGTAFKVLTAAGAVYTVEIHVRAGIVSRAPALGPGTNLLSTETARALDELLTHLETQFAQVDRHVAELRSDPALADSTRRSYEGLAANYKAMKDLYDHPSQPVDQYVSRALDLKGQHLRLVRALQHDLGIPVPPELLAILEATPKAEPAPDALVQFVPGPAQPRLRGRRVLGPQPPVPMGPRFGPGGPGGFNPAQEAQARARAMQRQMQQDLENRMRGLQPRLGP